jgi:Tfp pilus assembly PilM family ATPase
MSKAGTGQLLKNLGSGVRSMNLLSSGPGTDILGVDLVGGHVKIVHAKEYRENVVFKHFLERKFSEENEQEISQYLIECRKKLRISKTCELLCVVPSTLFISKNVDMPSRDDEEIKKIIDLQANRYTPYSRDELVIDYLCAETEKEHYTSVLLIIMNRKLMEQYCRIFEFAGFDVHQIVMAPEGMVSTYQKASGFAGMPDAVAGIHVAQEVSDLTIMDHGQVAFIRSIPVGADRLNQDRGEAQLEFLRELNKSMIAYQNQGLGGSLKCLVITGLTKNLGFLGEEMRKSIPILFASNIPIKMFNYEDQFNLSGNLTKELNEFKDTSFFEVMACISAHRTIHVDLTPKEVKLKKQFRDSSRNIITLGVTIMSAVLIISVFMVAKIYLKNTLLQKMNSIYEETFDEARVLEQMSTRSRFLRAFFQGRGRPVYMFERMSELISRDIYLKTYAFEDGKILKLSGTAVSMSKVFNFVTTLESSEYFTEVITTETKSRRAGGQDVADFSIECTLREDL